MANTLRVFDARVVGLNEVGFYVRSSTIEQGLGSDALIDSFVRELKLDLDRAAVEAKRLLRAEEAKPLFGDE